MKKTTIIALIIGVCALFVSVCNLLYVTGVWDFTKLFEKQEEASEGVTETDDSRVKIGIYSTVDSIWLLQANGGLITTPDSLNAKDGLDIEYVFTDGGAFNFDHYDAMTTTMTAYVYEQERYDNMDDEIVMPYIISCHKDNVGIVANSPITTPADLIGKKISLPKLPAEQYVWFEWYLNNESGLSEAQKQEIRESIDLTYFWDVTSRKFKDKEVDVCVNYDFDDTTNVVWNVGEAGLVSACGLLFREDFLTENPDFLTNLAKNAQEAERIYREIDRYSINEVLHDAFYQEVDEVENRISSIQYFNINDQKAILEDAEKTYLEIAEIIQASDDGQTVYPKKAYSAFADEYWA